MHDLKGYWFSRIDGKLYELLLILEAHDFTLGLDYKYDALRYYWIAYVPSQTSLFLYVESVSEGLFRSADYKYIPTEYLLSL